jgi:hypothetical protein
MSSITSRITTCIVLSRVRTRAVDAMINSTEIISIIKLLPDFVCFQKGVYHITEK